MALLEIAEALRLGAFALVGGAVVLLYLSHQRARATVFADLMLKATLLLMAAFYLGFVADNLGALPGDLAWYRLAVHAGYLLVAGFFALSAFHLWQFTRRSDGAVIVTPDVLNGLSSRTAKMYGESASRFIVYAVGKESAQKAAARLLPQPIDPESTLRKLPHWFRQMGYGDLRVTQREIRKEVHLTVRDTFESRHPGGSGCELTRGYLAGLGNVLHPELDCECVESRCGREQGEPCEFHLHWFPKAPEPVRRVPLPHEA